MTRKQNKKNVRIVETLRTTTPQGKVVAREYEAKLDGGEVGQLEYTRDLKRSASGFDQRFEKHFKNSDAGINFIGVERGHMNKGIGKKLLNKADKIAKKDKKKRLLLMVDDTQKKALKLYTKRGFKPIDKLKQSDVNWILMEKKI